MYLFIIKVIKNVIKKNKCNGFFIIFVLLTLKLDADKEIKKIQSIATTINWIIDY